MKKFFIRTIFIFLTIVIAVFGLLYFLLNDEVKDQYSTLDAAREDQLFERGWLPDILPPSARNIKTSNNLDVNTSVGQFSFNPSEYPLLEAKLQPYKQVVTPFVRWENKIEKLKRKGFTPLTYEAHGSIWVFFCKPEIGYCEYTLWSYR